MRTTSTRAATSVLVAVLFTMGRTPAEASPAPNVGVASQAVRNARAAAIPAPTAPLQPESSAAQRAVMTAVTGAGHRGAAAQRLVAAIMRESTAHGLDPLLLVAIIQVESEFDVLAISQRGAMGLMQIMPATGRWLGDRLGQPLQSLANLYDVDLNLFLATRYLAELRDRFGSLEYALLAYNAGPTAARTILADPDRRARWLKGYPAKVQRGLSALQASQLSEIETTTPATDARTEAAPRAAECARAPGIRSETAARWVAWHQNPPLQGVRLAVNSALFPGPNLRRRTAWPGG